MEGKCYTLVWGIKHFQQYLYQNHFTFHINHKPLDWLVIVSDAYGWKGRWINTLHDFNFKILHKVLSTPMLMHLVKILWMLLMNGRID